MLRYFQITSDELVYQAGVSLFDFPVRTKGHSRCAVVGIDVQPQGPATVNTREQAAYGTRVTRLQIGSRRYVQGDGVNLGLIAPVPIIGDGLINNMARGPAYFPGETIVHPNNQVSGGMPIWPGERILMEVDSPGEQLNRVILQCVEFDCATGDTDDPIWQALEQRGVGEVVIWGHQLDYQGIPLNAEEFEAQPRAPIATTLRRQQVRGVTTSDISDPTTAADIRELDFQEITAELYTQTNRAPHNEPVGARSVMSYGGYLIPGAGRVDLREEEKSYVRVHAPSSPAPRQLQVAQFFEGRPATGRFLNSADAVS